MRLILRGFINFFKDGGPLLAASIAYFFLMSFIPFCLLLVTLFGYLLGENRPFYDFFSARLMRFFPEATSGISRELTAVVVHRQIGILTAVVYVYFSYQLYQALESSVHIIFRQERKRSWAASIILSVVIITLIAAFVVISFAATSLVQMLRVQTVGPAAEIFPALQVGDITVLLIRFVIPVFLVLVIATTLYKLLPIKRIPLGTAVIGGLFTAVLLEAARHLFTLYVVTAAGQLGAIYGSLSTFVIFLMWIFYSACIFLTGAEIVRGRGETG